MSILDSLKGGLIVSCQAEEGSPFFDSESMAKFARAAELGGAVGIRAKAPDIPAIRAACSLPVIGLDKVHLEGYEVFITPHLADARRVVAAGADIVALDCTPRARPDGLTMEETVARIKAEVPVPVMADIATRDEAVAAERAGADIVATTLSGYTAYAPRGEGPDWELLEAIVAAVRVPVIAEGGIWTPAEARAALDLGAWAVVVGSAITRPADITKRFVAAM